MEKILWTIGEAAGTIGESVTLVRFWANSFPRHLKPKRNAKGNRLFSAEDMETLKQIHYLVKDKGMSLEGAGKQLDADRSKIEQRVRVLDSLKEIKSQLQRVKKSL